MKRNLIFILLLCCSCGSTVKLNGVDLGGALINHLIPKEAQKATINKIKKSF